MVLAVTLKQDYRGWNRMRRRPHRFPIEFDRPCLPPEHIRQQTV